MRNVATNRFVAGYGNLSDTYFDYQNGESYLRQQSPEPVRRKPTNYLAQSIFNTPILSGAAPVTVYPQTFSTQVTRRKNLSHYQEVQEPILGIAQQQVYPQNQHAEVVRRKRTIINNQTYFEYQELHNRPHKLQTFDYQKDGFGEIYFGFTNDIEAIAQTFRVPYTITNPLLQLPLGKFGNPTHDIEIYLAKDNGFGQPGTRTLVGTVNGTDIPSQPSFSFNYEGIVVKLDSGSFGSPGDTYWIILQPTATSFSDYFTIRSNLGALNQYGTTYFSSDDGATWQINFYDPDFQTLDVQLWSTTANGYMPDVAPTYSQSIPVRIKRKNSVDSNFGVEPHYIQPPVLQPFIDYHTPVIRPKKVLQQYYNYFEYQELHNRPYIAVRTFDVQQVSGTINTRYFGYLNDVEEVAQTIRIPYTITNPLLQIPLAKEGNPTDSVEVYLAKDNGSGQPGARTLIGSISGSELPQYDGDDSCMGAVFKLDSDTFNSPGDLYWVILSRSVMTDIDYYYVRRNYQTGAPADDIYPDGDAYGGDSLGVFASQSTPPTAYENLEIVLWSTTANGSLPIQAPFYYQSEYLPFRRQMQRLGGTVQAGHELLVPPLFTHIQTPSQYTFRRPTIRHITIGDREQKTPPVNQNFYFTLPQYSFRTKKVIDSLGDLKTDYTLPPVNGKHFFTLPQYSFRTRKAIDSLGDLKTDHKLLPLSSHFFTLPQYSFRRPKIIPAMPGLFFIENYPNICLPRTIWMDDGTVLVLAEYDEAINAGTGEWAESNVGIAEWTPETNNEGNPTAFTEEDIDVTDYDDECYNY